MPREVTIVECVRRLEKGEDEPLRHSCACPSCPGNNMRSDHIVSKRQSTTERISNEMLIEAVKRRAVLWNPEHPDHGKREEKQRVWGEVIEEFYGPDVKADQKSYMSMLLQERWRTLKTCFTKELTRKKRIELGLDNSTCRAEYVYYKQLYFLKDTMKSQTDVNQHVKDEIKDNQAVSKQSAYDMIYNPKEENFVAPESPQAKKIHFESIDTADGVKRRKNHDDKPKFDLNNDNLQRNDSKIETLKPLEATESPQFNKNICEHDIQLEKFEVTEAQNEVDEDKLFLMSLLKPLQTLPKSFKLPTKIKIMENIHKAQEESGVYQAEKILMRY